MVLISVFSVAELKLVYAKKVIYWFTLLKSPRLSGSRNAWILGWTGVFRIVLTFSASLLCLLLWSSFPGRGKKAASGPSSCPALLVTSAAGEELTPIASTRVLEVGLSVSACLGSCSHPRTNHWFDA